MKFIRCFSTVLSILLLAGCSKPEKSATSIDVAPPIAAPVALDGAIATLAISDVHGFLDEVGTVVSQVYPMMGGPMLKVLLGSKFGDPQLAGIAPSNGLAVVMLDPQTVFVVAEVQPAKAASYMQSLQETGLAVLQQGGLLLIAKDAASLAEAEPLATKVQADLLGAKRDASLRFSAKPAALMVDNEKMITDGIEQMLITMKQASASNNVMDVQRFFEAEVQVLLSLARQVESVEAALTPVDGSILMSETIQPAVDSRLAAYCNAPVLNDYSSTIQTGMLPDGVMKLEGCIRNPDALLTFFNGELANLSETMDLDPAFAAQWSAYMERWIKAMGSTFCESVFSGSDQLFGMTFLVDVEDERSILDVLGSMSADLEAAGLFRFYESMGMPLTVAFEENVRTVSGVKIHRLKMDYDLKNVPPEQAELMKSMMGYMQFDVAICKDVLIYTSDDSAVEKIIEQLNSGAVPASQLTARSVFPSGGMYYADWDVGRHLELTSSFMNKVPSASTDAPEMSAMLEPIIAVMTGAEPVVMACYCNSGRVKFCSQIPSDLLARIAQAGQVMVLEAIQGQAK